MIIKVQPQKCKSMAEEIGDSVKILNHTIWGLNEVIDELKKSDDESMRITSGKISKIADNLYRKTRSAEMMSAALYKIERVYSKTEENIQRKEDDVDRTGRGRIVSGRIVSSSKEGFFAFMKPICGPSPEYWKRRRLRWFIDHSGKDIRRFEWHVVKPPQRYVSYTIRLGDTGPLSAFQRAMRTPALKDMFEEF